MPVIHIRLKRVGLHTTIAARFIQTPCYGRSGDEREHERYAQPWRVKFLYFTLRMSFDATSQHGN
jgi:hypothetical protein